MKEAEDETGSGSERGDAGRKVVRKRSVGGGG